MLVNLEALAYCGVSSGTRCLSCWRRFFRRGEDIVDQSGRHLLLETVLQFVCVCVQCPKACLLLSRDVYLLRPLVLGQSITRFIFCCASCLQRWDTGLLRGATSIPVLITISRRYPRGGGDGLPIPDACTLHHANTSTTISCYFCAN